MPGPPLHVPNQDTCCQEGTNGDAIRKEYQVLRRLEHDRIVKAYGLEDELDEGIKGVAMILEMCHGSTLNKWLPWHDRDRDRMVLDVACRRQCLTQIASAIAYLHSVGIAHRDLHSKNVVVHASQSSSGFDSQSVQVKVIDLGCARDLDSDEAMEVAWIRPTAISLVSACCLRRFAVVCVFAKQSRKI